MAFIEGQLAIGTTLPGKDFEVTHRDPHGETVGVCRGKAAQAIERVIVKVRIPVGMVVLSIKRQQYIRVVGLLASRGTSNKDSSGAADRMICSAIGRSSVASTSAVLRMAIAAHHVGHQVCRCRRTERIREACGILAVELHRTLRRVSRRIPSDHWERSNRSLGGWQASGSRRYFPPGGSGIFGEGVWDHSHPDCRTSSRPRLDDPQSYSG